MSGQARVTIAPRFGLNGVGCAGTDGVLQSGEVVGSGDNGRDIVFGLVPDGNTSVALRFAKGVQHHVSVVDNVFKATVRPGPVTVAFRNAAGVPWSHRFFSR
jgi:hypothetical protein